MDWLNKVMVESPEEREFFATALAGQNEWRAEKLRLTVVREEARAANVAAQAFAPDGRYAFRFDEEGFEELIPYARYIYHDDDIYSNLIRIKAATRRL